MTYDLIDHSGQREDAGVHTILFKPSQQALGRIMQQRIEGKLTVLARLKCTPQPEHIAEAIYLHHRKYLKHIAAVHYIGEAATRQANRTVQGKYEEYRLVAITYTTDNTFDTSFTINYPKHTNTPNMPFTLVAGDKDTLINGGLDGRATRGMPDLLAARPIYRPDLNLTKDNMSSQCIFVKPRPNAPAGTHLQPSSGVTSGTGISRKVKTKWRCNSSQLSSGPTSNKPPAKSPSYSSKAEEETRNERSVMSLTQPASNTPSTGRWPPYTVTSAA